MGRNADRVRAVLNDCVQRFLCFMEETLQNLKPQRGPCSLKYNYLVDHKQLTGDVAGLGGRQESDGRCNLLRLPRSAYGNILGSCQLIRRARSRRNPSRRD